MGCCNSKKATGDVALQKQQSHEAKADDANFEEIKALVSIPFFDELDTRSLQKLQELFDRQSFKEGDVILEEGKESIAFNVIISGRVELSAMSGGKSVPLSQLGKGEWFGDTTVVDDHVQSATVRALEDTVLLSMSVEEYRKSVQRYPELTVSLCSLGTMPSVRVQLREIPFFKDVEDSKLRLLATLFDFRKCKGGEALCRQGDDADGFYYLVDGRVAVSAVGPKNEQVHLATLSKGDYFGEIALIENTTRTATITSTQDCVLLYLNRDRFNRFLALAPEIIESGMFQQLILKRTANSLKAIPLFSVFETKQKGPLKQFEEGKLALLGALFKFAQFNAGDVVYSEGDEANAFFLIVQGSVEVSVKNSEGEEVSKGTLTVNDWFGESSLVHDRSRRAQTVKCTEPCVVLKLIKENFQSFLQSAPAIADILKARVDLRTAARMRDISFFSGLRENKPWSKRDMLAGLFTFEDFNAGTTIFCQGDEGDKFYIIVEGLVDIYTARKGRKDAALVDTLKRGEWFGEVVMFEDTPRTATAVAQTDLQVLWTNKEQFHKFLTVAPELSDKFQALVKHRTSKILETFDILSSIVENKPWSKIEMLGTLFHYETVPAGHVVFKDGDQAEKFYLIVSGTVGVVGKNENGEEVDLGDLEEQAHFGETCLLTERERHTTVTAKTQCVFLYLKKKEFAQFMEVCRELRPLFSGVLRKRKQSLGIDMGDIALLEEKDNEE